MSDDLVRDLDWDGGSDTDYEGNQEGNAHNQQDQDALEEAGGNEVDWRSTYYELQSPETTCSVQHSCFGQ